MKLTAVVIERLKPKIDKHRVRVRGKNKGMPNDDYGKPIRTEIPDSGARGLWLVIYPDLQKSWVMRFRKPSGKAAKLTLGTVNHGKPANGEPVLGGPLTLAEARALATEVNRQRASGRDVVAENKTEKDRRRAEAAGKGDGFAAVAAAFIEGHKVRKTGQRPRDWREKARILGLRYADEKSEPELIEGGLAQRWAKAEKSIGQVTGHDVHAVIQEAVKDGIPGTEPNNPEPSDNRGRKMADALGSLFKWAMRHRRASMTANPMAGAFRPPPPPSRDRVLTQEEIRLLWRALDDESVGYPYPQITRLLLLTGCRLNEIAKLPPEELDAGLTRIELPGKRTKNGLPHVVPLAPQAREIIQGALKVGRKFGKSGYVFTAGSQPTTGWSRAKARIDAAITELNGGEPIPAWRLHDLRRTAATGMAEDLKIAPHIVEAALNHVSGAKAGVAGTYNRALYLEERKSALHRWAAHVEGVVTGRPANVVLIKKRSGR